MPAASASVASEIGSVMKAIGENAVAAARVLAQTTTATKNTALTVAAQTLRAKRAEILAANDIDMAQARARGLTSAMLDRLQLDDKRIDAMAQGLEEIAKLADPVGTVIAEW